MLIGTRPITKLLGQVRYTCPSCHHYSWHSVGRTKRYFTLVFVPIFPITKSHISRCNLCGFIQRLSEDEAAAWFKQTVYPSTTDYRAQPSMHGTLPPAQSMRPPARGAMPPPANPPRPPKPGPARVVPPTPAPRPRR
jgi:hypothetical protein